MQLMEGLNGLSGCLANQRQGADSMGRFVGYVLVSAMMDLVIRAEATCLPST